MDTLHSLILGIVQGVTEFLPVSSSAHLILIPWLLHWKDPGLAFDVFLHLGTLVAIFGYFFQDWWRIGMAGLQSILERKIGFDRDRSLFWLLVMATIPGAVAGFLFHDQAETLFRAPLLISITLASLGFFLYWVDGKYPALKNTEEIKMWDAVLIGIAQAFAVIPGISRSGSTMMMARWRGFTRESAARFSFLLSFPITLGACLFEFKKFATDTVITVPPTYLAAGFLGSLIFGVGSIHFLLQYLRNADFKVFAWYRVGLAVFVVLWSLIFKM